MRRQQLLAPLLESRRTPGWLSVSLRRELHARSHFVEMRNVRDQPRTTWEDLADDLKGAGSTVSKVTLSYTLRCHGLPPCSTGKGPRIKPVHVQTHMKFASDQLDEPEEAWEKVLWSNETKIELFGINSTCRLWRKKKDEYSPKNIIPTVNLGGVMYRQIRSGSGRSIHLYSMQLKRKSII